MKQENKNLIDLQKNTSEISQEKLEQNKNKKENFFKEMLKFALLAAIIVLPIRIFIAQPVMVSGRSMDPTFADKQYLIVDQITPNFKEFKRGDVIVFRYPNNTKKLFIKRIIGLPNETVNIHGDKIIIKDNQNKKNFSLKEAYIDIEKIRDVQISITLKDDEYFVMGDNRNESNDSRIWGPLKRTLIMGRPVIRLFPIGKFGFFPGSYTIELSEENDL